MSLLARDSQDAIEGDAMCVYVHPRAGRGLGCSSLLLAPPPSSTPANLCLALTRFAYNHLLNLPAYPLIAMHIRIPHIAGLEDIPDGIDLPQISPATAAGIGVAIAGNILISLALNCQKLAHRRLEREREAAAQAPRPHEPNSRVHDVDDPQFRHQYALPVTNLPTLHSETEPLLEPGYVAVGAGEPPKLGRRWFFFRRTPYRYHAHDIDSGHLASTHALMPVEVVPASSGSSASHSNGEQKHDSKDGSESDYLKSKLWYGSLLLFRVTKVTRIQVVRLPPHECGGDGQFHLLCICTRVCGGSFGNRTSRWLFWLPNA